MDEKTAAIFLVEYHISVIARLFVFLFFFIYMLAHALFSAAHF